MIETVPGFLLVVMIIITIVLLPRLNDERPAQVRDRARRTEELHIKHISRDE